MPLISKERVLKEIPSMFEINLNIDKAGIQIFRKLEKILLFDEGFIYYSNPDSLQLKYSYKNHKKYKQEQIYNIGSNEKKQIFSKSGYICNSEHPIIKCLDLSELNQNSYIIAKISIKSVTAPSFVFPAKSIAVKIASESLVLDIPIL